MKTLEKNIYNISINNECTGCGVCVENCPMKIISLEPDKFGFYTATISKNDECIN